MHGGKARDTRGWAMGTYSQTTRFWRQAKGGKNCFFDASPNYTLSYQRAHASHIPHIYMHTTYTGTHRRQTRGASQDPLPSFSPKSLQHHQIQRRAKQKKPAPRRRTTPPCRARPPAVPLRLPRQQGLRLLPPRAGGPLLPPQLTFLLLPCQTLLLPPRATVAC